MANFAIAIFVTIIIIGSIKIFLKFIKDLKFSRNMPCPGLPLPLVGHSHFLMNINREDILETILGIAQISLLAPLDSLKSLMFLTFLCIG